ncbi:MAG: Uncharacterized protein XD93_0111 [candidate division WS6 bacterium 34_10]|jgi:hypothetical protein|uniref:DUF4349 domain-containing protein n=1 Tax=candidate division WS6 bacterium 34_10 TaxID=1641389 RepID=A0A101HJ21_9BACT|nr:MAG: Uncharacterized protein XD93_0111 [candidate division WS6 bacterium 34_10]
MALSDKKKKIIIISSVVGFVLVGLVGIYLRFYSSRSYLTKSVEDLDYSIGTSPTYEQSYGYPEEATGRGMELDSLNYDEANMESKIRKSGSINLTVESLEEANDEVLDILDNYNGSVVSSNESGVGNNKSISITLKVPVKYFENLFEEVKDIEGKVDYASYYTDDVTQEYTDLQSRLKNLKATETQLVKILETADTVEDTLAVFNQLSSTRSQIEVLEGQIKYLDNQVDYSYLTVNLSLSDVGKEVKDEKWEPFGVVKSAFSALVDFSIGIVDLLIWVIVFSPVILIPLAIVLLIIKKRKKGKK